MNRPLNIRYWISCAQRSGMRLSLKAALFGWQFLLCTGGIFASGGHCQDNFSVLLPMIQADLAGAGKVPVRPQLQVENLGPKLQLGTKILINLPESEVLQVPDYFSHGIGVKYSSHPRSERSLFPKHVPLEIQAKLNSNYLTFASQFILPVDTVKQRLPANRIRPVRLALAGSTVVGVNWLIYESFKDVWWDREKGKFHFYRGWRRTTGFWDLGPHDSLWFHMDKLGHVYCGRLLAQTFTDMGHWVGFRPMQSYWIGALVSSLLMLEIELYDSQFKDWGFSIGDFIANEIGAFAPLMRYRFPILNDFALKLSYRPSVELSEAQYFVEDYAGMTFWLSMPFYRVLPETFRQVWPQFLNLALGYSITKKAHGETELFLALDYRLTQFAPKSGILAALLTKLDYLHLPAPTIRFRPDGKAFLFYF